MPIDPQSACCILEICCGSLSREQEDALVGFLSDAVGDVTSKEVILRESAKALLKEFKFKQRKRIA